MTPTPTLHPHPSPINSNERIFANMATTTNRRQAPIGSINGTGTSLSSAASNPPSTGLNQQSPPREASATNSNSNPTNHMSMSGTLNNVLNSPHYSLPLSLSTRPPPRFIPSTALGFSPSFVVNSNTSAPSTSTSTSATPSSTSATLAATTSASSSSNNSTHSSIMPPPMVPNTPSNIISPFSPTSIYQSAYGRGGGETTQAPTGATASMQHHQRLHMYQHQLRRQYSQTIGYGHDVYNSLHASNVTGSSGSSNNPTNVSMNVVGGPATPQAPYTSTYATTPNLPLTPYQSPPSPMYSTVPLLTPPISPNNLILAGGVGVSSSTPNRPLTGSELLQQTQASMFGRHAQPNGTAGTSGANHRLLPSPPATSSLPLPTSPMQPSPPSTPSEQQIIGGSSGVAVNLAPTSQHQRRLLASELLSNPVVSSQQSRANKILAPSPYAHGPGGHGTWKSNANLGVGVVGISQPMSTSLGPTANSNSIEIDIAPSLTTDLHRKQGQSPPKSLPSNLSPPAIVSAPVAPQPAPTTVPPSARPSKRVSGQQRAEHTSTVTSNTSTVTPPATKASTAPTSSSNSASTGTAPAPNSASNASSDRPSGKKQACTVCHHAKTSCDGRRPCFRWSVQ